MSVRWGERMGGSFFSSSFCLDSQLLIGVRLVKLLRWKEMGKGASPFMGKDVT